jgi:hypothetical protein
MSHRDSCPDRWQVRRDAERDAEDGYHRRRPYDCDEANREYSRQINYAEERMAEERAAERAAERRRESAREEERQYQEYCEQQEYYAYLDAQEEEAYWSQFQEQISEDGAAVSDWESEGGFVLASPERQPQASEEIPF